jgi:catechol 2,3-dioxygenase-like lactoylglutathione lyase family enzyme
VTVRIRRISRVVRDLDRAEAFYRDALNFHPIARGAEEVVMRLGGAEIALVRFAIDGDPYPQDSQSNDLWFQHLAIEVSDMDAAYAHLTRFPGWRPITQDGPQLLPPANGNVRAFKFRDPDGHPLELLWFPSRTSNALFVGVDHTALSIASTARSIDFYTALGFAMKQQSLNTGPAQSRLDSLQDAHVQVTALHASTGPGVELLAYTPPGRSAATIQPNDTATDWVTIEVAAPQGPIRDPDGHRLLLVAHRSV